MGSRSLYLAYSQTWDRPALQPPVLLREAGFTFGTESCLDRASLLPSHNALNFFASFSVDFKPGNDDSDLVEYGEFIRRDAFYTGV